MTSFSANPKLQPGGAAPEFRLSGIDGDTLCLSDVCTRSSAVVVLFICNHCPYVQAYIPRLIALHQELNKHLSKSNDTEKVKKPVAFLAINSNDASTYPEDSFEQMKVYAERWGLNFPYLHDPTQAVARAFGANRTPEIFVLDPKGICHYEGGIDDNYQNESKVTRRPLRDAAVAVASGHPVTHTTSFAIGCTIKWKKP